MEGVLLKAELEASSKVVGMNIGVVILHNITPFLFNANSVIVVYFDQCLGAVHSKRWSKYAFFT